MNSKSSDLKSILVIGGKLTLFCAVSALLLGFVNAVTDPVITQRKQQELLSGISAVAGEGKVGELKIVEGDPVVSQYYPVLNQSGKTTGYVLQLTGFGYGGDMKLLAGFGNDGTVNNIVLMDNQETPGLGKKAESPEYMKKFTGTGGAKPVPVLKAQLSSKDADAITGATLTFGGIARAVAVGSSFVKKLGGNQ